MTPESEEVLYRLEVAIGGVSHPGHLVASVKGYCTPVPVLLHPQRADWLGGGPWTFFPISP